MSESNNQEYKDYCKEIFREWILDQIEVWICKYGAWDTRIEDGSIDLEDWEYIKNHLTVKEIKIGVVGDE